jgi:hypothetical protein
MAGFLYYKPNVSQPVTIALAREWGLGYAFTAAPSSGQCLGPDTPSGTNGMVFADGARMGDWTIRVDMAEQSWRKIPKSDCYVGYWNASPPLPEELLRPKYLTGYLTRIGSHEWIIPLTARFDDSRKLLATSLPCYVDCDDDGNWVEGDVLDVHRRLWEIGAPFRDDIMAQKLGESAAREFSDEELYSTALAYIQANYVVGQRELAMMQALTKNDSSIRSAILLANDYPTLARWAEEQKKKRPAYDSRWLEHKQWRSGLAPNYRPTFADLVALAMEW